MPTKRKRRRVQKDPKIETWKEVFYRLLVERPVYAFILIMAIILMIGFVLTAKFSCRRDPGSNRLNIEIEKEDVDLSSINQKRK